MGELGDVRDALDPTVEQMLAGDEGAFRELYRTMHPPLLRYLTILVGAADAEDVASETWGQAFRDLGRFQGGADEFRAWVTTIGRHRAMDHLRRRVRRVEADFSLEDALELPDQADIAAHVVDVESTQGALALLADLPSDQAEAIVLRVILEFDAPTAARILGKRPGAVRSAAHRGLKTLAQRVEQVDGALVATLS